MREPSTTGLGPKSLDTINLERALIDFEIANARVVDLTARLTELSSELLKVRSDLGLAQLTISELSVQNEELSRQLADLRSSIAYRIAHFLGDFRAKAMRR